MKKIFILVLLLTTFKFESVQANDVGAGIILGIPSALTGKFWLDDKAAIDVGLAFAFDSYLMVYADYLHHFPKLFGTSHGKFLAELTPYLGVGGVIVFTNKRRTADEGFYGKESGAMGLGIRVPGGVEWRPAAVKWLGVYAELAPGLTIVPKTSGFFQGGIGARYYF